jgi:hypothetical protein
MAKNLNAFVGKPRALGERVLVSDMYFGEQTTASGIVLSNDDGTTRGIYPRWAKVYDKGSDNTDPFSQGQWILIEHGRWTRGFLVNDGKQELELRMVDPEAILAYTDEKPDSVQLGFEYSNGSTATIS